MSVDRDDYEADEGEYEGHVDGGHSEDRAHVDNGGLQRR